MKLSDVDGLLALHDGELERWYAEDDESGTGLDEELPPEGADLATLVSAQHRCNFHLWNLEDEARRRDVDDAYVVGVKRAIDAWNQRRNDLIEYIDGTVLSELESARHDHAEQHSETVGMMIDRLSILALKVRHMDANARRDEDAGLVEECLEKLDVLREQRADLARCLARLVDDLCQGRRFFKLYRQHKSYNDPRLNPSLRGGSRPTSR